MARSCKGDEKNTWQMYEHCSENASIYPFLGEDFYKVVFSLVIFKRTGFQGVKDVQDRCFNCLDLQSRGEGVK